MLETQYHTNPITQIGHCIVSCIFVLLTHLALSAIPCFFFAFSFLTQLAPSALLFLLLLGFDGWCRRTLFKAKASAPAFVFFNILFIWVFYFSVIRPTVSQLKDAVFNCGIVFLFIGLYRIITSDPGIVTIGPALPNQPMESSLSQLDEELEFLASGLRYQHTRDPGFLRSVRKDDNWKLSRGVYIFVTIGLLLQLGAISAVIVVVTTMMVGVSFLLVLLMIVLVIGAIHHWASNNLALAALLIGWFEDKPFVGASFGYFLFLFLLAGRALTVLLSPPIVVYSPRVLLVYVYAAHVDSAKNVS